MLTVIFLALSNMIWLIELPIFRWNAFIFVDFGYDWCFVISLCKFIREWNNLSIRYQSYPKPGRINAFKQNLCPYHSPWYVHCVDQSIGISSRLTVSVEARPSGGGRGIITFQNQRIVIRILLQDQEANWVHTRRALPTAPPPPLPPKAQTRPKSPMIMCGRR